MSICKASEILRNETYIAVRRSASGSEGLRPGGTRDEGNPPKADKRSRWAFSDSLIGNLVVRGTVNQPITNFICLTSTSAPKLRQRSFTSFLFLSPSFLNETMISWILYFLIIFSSPSCPPKTG
jgi:hypothetical protein